jgi:predicted aconitase with swiveling domain
MELLRLDLAPAAIVLCEPDGIISLGALAAAEIYDSWLPIIEITLDQFESVTDGAEASVISQESGASIDF